MRICFATAALFFFATLPRCSVAVRNRRRSVQQQLEGTSLELESEDAYTFEQYKVDFGKTYSSIVRLLVYFVHFY